MATIQLYRTDLSLFATAVSAIANVVPLAPTLATANTTSPLAAAVYVVDAAGSFFVINGNRLSYDAATGRLTDGGVISIEYHGFDAGPGSFAVFSDFFANVPELIKLAGQPDPVETFFGKGLFFGGRANTIIAETAALTAPGGDDVITVSNSIASRIGGGGGTDTAVFRTFRGDAILSGGNGSEEATVAGITTSLVSVERLQFLDGATVESASTLEGQTVLAFQAVFGRLPDAINTGGYGAVSGRFGVGFAASQMLATPEGQSVTGSLDNGQFVTRLYQNVLGRAPTTTELATARASLDSGRTNRGAVVSGVVAVPEAATANAGVFANSGVFAASPGAVDTLRAYQVLLGRLPEASSLASNATALDQFYSGAFSFNVFSKSLPDLYRTIQSSAEFAARTTPNSYGITAGSSFGTVYAATHSDALTATNLALVTATGGVSHLPG